jgi:S1-C subfamily serine protease
MDSRLAAGPLPARAAAPPPPNRRPAAAPPEEDDDRPRRPAPSAGNGLALVLGLVAAGVLFVLCLGGGGVAALLLVSRNSAPPEAARPLPAQNLAGDVVKPVAEAGPPAPVAPLAPAAPALPPIRPAAPGPGDAGSIPLETMRALKAATTFIKVEYPGEAASGSGFLIRAQGDTGYVVTNHHVITPEKDVPRPRFGPRFRFVPAGKPTITVVFASGTREEEAARAEVAADDGDADLAVLRVRGVRSWPRPFDFRQQPPLVETMPIYLFGFPFGEALAMHKGNPAITVGKGAVSSIRLDDRGELALVQIDGDVNPGNSGGPVVDARGQLVGVTVAKVRNTNIGLAVPAQQLVRLLAGRASMGRVMSRAVDNATTEVQVEARVQDPLGALRGVSVLCARAEAAPAGNGPWPPLAGAQEAALTVQGDRATASLRVNGGATDQFAFQIAYVNGDGQQTFTQPLLCRLGTGGAPVAQTPAPLPGGPRPGPPLRGDLPDETVTGAGRTRLIGGGFGGDPYTDAAPDGALLVGLEVGLGKFFDLDMVHSVRAVFRVGAKESLGTQHGSDLTRVTRLVAKPGYAVGAMTIKAGANADGLSLTFMRIKGDKLDPSDSYESEWLGDPRPGRKTVLTGNGRPVVGIIGKAKENNTGIGLLFDRNAKDDDMARPNPVQPPGGEKGADRQFVPRNGQYTATLPAGVRSRQRTSLLTIKGHRVPVESAENTLADGTVYLVASVGIPAVVMRQVPSEERFDTFRDILVQASNGKLVREKDLQQGDVRGKEYLIEGGRGVVRMQLYLKGGWVLYALVEGKTEDVVTSREAGAFFDSFKIMDKK